MKEGWVVISMKKRLEAALRFGGVAVMATVRMEHQ
jgi:hypothetical protein